MLNEVKGQNPHEMTISEIHNTMVQIQMASTRILMAIDILLRVDGCAEEMEDDMPDEYDPESKFDLLSNPLPRRAQAGENESVNRAFRPLGDLKTDRAQTGTVMGYTDRSIWLCPRCVTVITNLEYVHLNRDGCCEECETQLEQYEKVEWRP